MEARPLADYARACGDLVDSTAGSLDALVRELANDSRSVNPGTLFVAIHGAQVDGRAFIGDAVARGAAGVVCTGDFPVPADVPVIRVSDDYAALGRLAEFHLAYPARHVRLVGITGTNGKTTTAFLLRDIFRAAGMRVGMIGTVCYDLGDEEVPADRTTPTPLGFQGLLSRMVSSGVELAVVEVSSHALVQRRIGSARCEAGIFTNLTGDHLDYHQTVENYFLAKSLLFTEYLASDGWAVLNADDPYGCRLVAELGGRRTATFSISGEATYRVLDREMSLGGVELQVDADGRTLQFHSPLIGDYNVSNVLGAAAAALRLGAPADIVCRAVEQFAGVPGRMERVPGGGDITVVVDYAHTDDALQNVLHALRPLCRRGLCVVFGCGGDRDRSKRPRMGRAASEIADTVIVTSDNPRTEAPDQIIADILPGLVEGSAHQVIVDRRQAILQAVGDARPGDTVLLAGKGHEDYQQIGDQKLPFSDLAIAREGLANRRKAL